MYKVVHKRM